MRAAWLANRKQMLLAFSAIFFLILPGMALSACNGLNLSCLGPGVKCTYPTPTPNMSAIMATVNSLSNKTPVLVDPLSQQDASNWDDDSNCYFQNGTYIFSEIPPTSNLDSCMSNALNYTDVAIQVDVTLISGYGAGLLFRVSPDQSKTYVFELTDQGQFRVIVITDKNSPLQYLVPVTANTAIHPVGQKNTLLVIAKGSDFQFLINGVFVAETHDSSLANGGIGFCLDVFSGQHNAAKYSHLVVYSL